jgi:hypothetical protein
MRAAGVLLSPVSRAGVTAVYTSEGEKRHEG